MDDGPYNHGEESNKSDSKRWDLPPNLTRVIVAFLALLASGIVCSITISVFPERISSIFNITNIFNFSEEKSENVVPTETLLPTIAPAGTQRFVRLRLDEGIFWPEGYNIELTTTPNEVREQELLGIPFEIGRQINTEGCYVAANSNEIILDTSIVNPAQVFFLIQAGHGFASYESISIGHFELHFSDGRFLSQNLILGVNIRDWARRKDEAVTTISSETTVGAWEGLAGGPDAGELGGMDILRYPIPEDYRDSVLTSVRVIDTSEGNSGILSGKDPCIHLQAVTVETVSR